jgi:NAD(P)-dependent dehydrogenase (short-subunit alcohol dehydrogenase family)
LSGAVVVGGSGGLGAALVRALAAQGHAVSFTYRSDASAAQALATETDAQAQPLDLSDRAAVDAFADALVEDAPGALVYNAGQSYDALTAMMDQDRAEAVMQVNFWAFARIAKVVGRAMARARRGRIVAVGSVAALRGNQGNAAYAASKGALISYCRTLAMELARRGVTVNVIAPGFVDTPMMAKYDDHRAKMEMQIPLGRFAQPGEIAPLAAFLCGPGGAYVTGAVLPVDGGLTAHLGVHR